MKSIFFGNCGERPSFGVSGDGGIYDRSSPFWSVITGTTIDQIGSKTWRGGCICEEEGFAAFFFVVGRWRSRHVDIHCGYYQQVQVGNVPATGVILRMKGGEEDNIDLDPTLSCGIHGI